MKYQTVLSNEVTLYFANSYDTDKKITLKRNYSKQIQADNFRNEELLIITIPQCEPWGMLEDGKWENDFEKDEYGCIAEFPDVFKPVTKEGITFLGYNLNGNNWWLKDFLFADFARVVKETGFVAGWYEREILFAATNEYSFLIEKIFDMFKSKQVMIQFLVKNDMSISTHYCLEILKFDKDRWIDNHLKKN